MLSKYRIVFICVNDCVSDFSVYLVVNTIKKDSLYVSFSI